MGKSKYSITPPTFRVGDLPEGEWQAARAVQTFIGGLASYIDDFEATLGLFDYVETLEAQNFLGRHLGRWKHIAARDGAMTIYHFGKVVVNSGKGLKHCPSIWDRVDRASLRKAREKFERAFPKATKIRDSTAHRAEISETKEKVALHSFSGPSGNGFIETSGGGIVTMFGALFGRRFTNTYEGGIISYDVSEHTLAALSDIASEFYEGFSIVDRTPMARRSRFRLPQAQ